MAKTYDFSGYATKANLKCSDGRTILPGAFKEMNGQKVPLVWQHVHDDPNNILGHAMLEYKDSGDVYAYCTFNDTAAAKTARELVKHGDIHSLSIYANDLVQQGKHVMHGVIREVSLVLAGANPGARIDFLSISHGDGTETELDDEAVIFHGDSEFKLAKEEKKDLKHAEEGTDEETVQQVFDTLSDKQKDVVYFMLAKALEGEGSGEATHSDEEGDQKVMKHNVFEGETEGDAEATSLTHEQFQAVMADAMKIGSFRQALMHAAQEYGITNIEYLFPDARENSGEPTPIMREQAWVSEVYNGSFHTPFSRLKTTCVDMTVETARALGYVKAALKKEIVVGLLKRVVTPTTVYVKQKLDRDDIVDITDMDVVAWQKRLMRVMLNEELARAILVSDGRDAENTDKIDEKCIIPIYKDDDLYAHHVTLAPDKTVGDFIDECVRARKNYKGSGSPTMFTTTDLLTEMLLLKDEFGHRLYATEAELASALRVSKIVEVPLMEGVTRDVTQPVPATLGLKAIIVNMKDYSVGADRGGEIADFEDFDIDYNQYKYLMEGRCSGMLTLPKSALVMEQVIVPPPAG